MSHAAPRPAITAITAEAARTFQTVVASSFRPRGPSRRRRNASSRTKLATAPHEVAKATEATPQGRRASDTTTKITRFTAAHRTGVRVSFRA